MRHFHILSVIALTLASCAPVQMASVAEGPVQMQQVTWRENTPFFARSTDGRDCEAEALGVSIVASDSEKMAAIASISNADRDARRDACMISRGYVISVKPLCRPGETDGKQVFLSALTDALPPLSAVKCLVPGDSRAGSAGFVLV